MIHCARALLKSEEYSLVFELVQQVFSENLVSPINSLDPVKQTNDQLYSPH